MHQTFLQFFPEQSPPAAGPSPASGNRIREPDLTTLAKMLRALNEEREEDALALYAKLGPEARKSKDAQFFRCRAALRIDEAEFASAVEEFNALFPKLPCLEFLNLDYFLAKEQYPKAISTIDRIDKLVGGDPYLNVIRAMTFTMSKKYPEARRYALKALQQDPSLDDAYEPLIQATVAERDYRETVELLKRYDRALNFTLNDPLDDDLYTGFRESPEYQEWVAYLKQRDKK